MFLEIEEYKNILKNKYSQANTNFWPRYLHSLSVGRKAVEIVKTFNFDCDLKKIEIAGILHDYAKYETMDNYNRIVQEYKLDENILKENPKILHALLGSYFVLKEVGIKDEQILNAIKYHATGSLEMDRFSEVIYVADVSEDLRQGSGFDRVREYLKTDFRKAIIEKINFSLTKNDTILNRNLLKKYQEGK